MLFFSSYYDLLERAVTDQSKAVKSLAEGLARQISPLQFSLEAFCALPAPDSTTDDGYSWNMYE